METSQIQAAPRTAKGSRAAFNLRREGQLPAVIYGEGKPPELISIAIRDFETALRHHNRVLDLGITGGTQKVLIQEIQWNNLGDTLEHVDLLRISHHSVVEVTVELEFVGHPKGLSHGGEFVKSISDLQIKCAPDAIPESVRVLVGDLDLNMSVHVSDLELPQGVQAMHEPDEVVCAVHTRAEEPEPGEVEEEAEEGSAEPEVISKGKEEEPKE